MTAMQTTTVKAKDAPLGVQLWPTTSPEFAPNFTLASVIRQLDANGREYVIWQYQNGNTRTFLPDEDVAVEIARQFCRKGAHDCIPAVTIEFEANGPDSIRRLHWCAEHASDADPYRTTATRVVLDLLA